MQGQAPAKGIRLLARRIAAVIAECNYAQRRLTTLTVSTNRYEPQPNRAPDTYAEFLARTNGPLLREPAAAGRVAGKSVR